VRAIAKLAVRTLAFIEPGRRGGCFELARDRAGRFSQARVRVGGDLAYRAVVRLLDSLAAESLTRLEIIGEPPKPAERKRVDAAISRVRA